MLAAFLCPTPFVTAADSCSSAQWERFRTPSHEDLLLLPGSDIDCFAMGGPDESTIYAIGTWNSPCANDTTEDPFSPHGMLFNSGQAPRLWKSSDGGTTWKDRTERVLDAANLPDTGGGKYDDLLVFTAVAAAPDDPDMVIVAGYDLNGTAVIVGSNDGADEFSWLGCNAVDGVVLCASIAPEVDGMRHLAVGTADAVNGGRIWRYEAGRYWAGFWTDTSAESGWTDNPYWNNDSARVHAVTSLAFSPDYANDRTVMAAVIADAEEPDGDPYEGFYLIAGRWDSSSAWNAEAGLHSYPLLVRDSYHVIHAPSALPAFLQRGMTSVALPSDYDGDRGASRVVLIAVNGTLVNPPSNSIEGEGGCLFWAHDTSLSEDLLGHEDNPWVASIDYHGTIDMRGRILVGTSYPLAWSWDDIHDWYDGGSPALSCCEGVPVLYSEANDPCCPHWYRPDRLPSGQFNARVAWSPDGATAFAATSGAGRLWHEGLWYADESAFSRSTVAADGWVQTGLVDTMIELIVGIADDLPAATFYLHTTHTTTDGRVCRCESIWRTGDEGITWHRELHGMPDANDDDEDEFDDIIEGYYRGFYKPRTEGYLQAAGVSYLIGDAIDEDDEEQVEAGFAAGAVYRLVEGGNGDWQRMTDLILNHEGLVYMHCEEAPGATLYSGFDNLWWDYTDNEPLAYQSDGSDPDCPTGHDCRKVSGVARCLDPGRQDCCGEYEWDYLIRGLRGTADPDGIYEQLQLAGASCRGGHVRLWAIDEASRYWATEGAETESYDWCTGRFANNWWGRLWKYDDCYAMASVTSAAGDEPLTIPSDPCNCAHEEFILEWNRVCDACEYEVQIALDRQFRHLALTTEAFLHEFVAEPGTRFYRPPEPAQPSLLVKKGMLDCNQSYWWRARAHLAETDEVISSWWSEPEEFYTAPGPPGLIELRAPGDGVTKVPVKNAGFTWTQVSGATRYDFMLVDRERGHVASQVADSTSFVLPMTLEYDTPYVWRVIALDGDRVVAESARATFRTEPEPAAPQETPPGTSFTPPAMTTTDDWVWYFIAVLTLLLGAVLAVLSHVNRRIRRSRRAHRNAGARKPGI